MDYKIVRKILPVIGIFLFIYIIIQIGIDKIIDALSVINPIYGCFLIFLWVPHTLVYVYMWHSVQKKHKININFLSLLKIALIGNFYGLITPGGIGWFITPFYLRKKSGESIEKCTTDVLISESIHSLALLLLSLIGLIVLIGHFAHFLPAIIILIAILVVLCIIFMNEKTGKKAIRFFLKMFLPGRYKKDANDRVDLLYEDFPAAKELLFPFLLAFLHWIVYFSEGYLVAKLLLIDVPYIYFILIYPIGVIVAGIPITIGGVGIREGALVTLFSVFGVAPAQIVALSLLNNVILSWIVTAGIGATLAFTEMKKDRKE